MSLGEQLAKIREGAKKRIPPERLAIMHNATDQLRRSGILDDVIGAGDPLPPFALENTRGETVRSADILARGPLVITVFRGAW